MADKDVQKWCPEQRGLGSPAGQEVVRKDAREAGPLTGTWAGGAAARGPCGMAPVGLSLANTGPPWELFRDH